MKKRKLFLWIQAALCVLLCVLFSAEMIHMYTEGRTLREAGDLSVWIYTREKVVQKLTDLLPLFLLELVFLLTSLFWNRGGREVLPADAESVRDLICGKVNNQSESMRKERSRQRKLAVYGRAGAAACLIPVVLYMVNPSHFESTELETVMASLLLHIVPWISMALGLLSVTEVLREKSMVRETEAAKAQIREERISGSEAKPESAYKEKKTSVRTWAQAAMLLIAVALILHGIFNGSMQDVLIKAIHICTECIGLG